MSYERNFNPNAAGHTDCKNNPIDFGAPQQFALCTDIPTFVDCNGVPVPPSGGVGGSLFSLFSKLSPIAGAHPDFPSAVHIGSITAGPLVNWLVYEMCAAALPPNDSNGHFWELGAYTVNTQLPGNTITLSGLPSPICLATGPVYTLPGCVTTVVTSSGIQGDGTVANPIRENFDNLPLVTPGNPNTMFVVAGDGVNNDGSLASLMQVTLGVISTTCQVPPQPWDPTLPLLLMQDCRLTEIAPPVACPLATFDNLFLSSNGAYQKPNHRWNWLPAILTASTTVSLAANNAFKADASAGSFTVTVPAPVGCDNTEVVIKRYDNNPATVVRVVFTPLIDGIPGFDLQPNAYWGGLRGEAIEASWSGTEWSII